MDEEDARGRIFLLVASIFHLFGQSPAPQGVAITGA